ncbi:SGNH/GDSL hydrolase family protein [Paraburkholderia sp. CNPSo 3157]|uniref:SGNH/GDSL hydrolase family protein n=1 Tax=Paraburkholderia franconis TaxID=2654983 RepID=A0A7X1NGV4_9BURK|nr:SGNH/GDSL hydrolase family protein [Paraburkholderia franconis]MPW21278.1 SGNH/GDSL hydrolase family protein [Paraburkholderia franconis]
MKRALSVCAAACALALSAPALSHADDNTQSQVLIEAYGDSTTLGISCIDGRCGPQPDNAVTYLQDELRAKYGARVTVANLGVGGTMASQLRDGTGPGRNGPWKARLAASNAQIVTINYGINEVMHNQTPEQFYEAETDLVKTAQALGKLPVLQTSNPMPDGRLNTRLAAMAAMTRRVAAEQHVPLVDQYAAISSMADWKTQMSDGAHPKPGLYRVKAQQDFRVIDPLVQRMFDVAAASVQKPQQRQQPQRQRSASSLHSTSGNPTKGNS